MDKNILIYVFIQYIVAMLKTNRETQGNISASLQFALQREFITRCQKNSAYSLRAYSHFLGIDQSLLSKILRGKRKISALNAKNLILKLGLKEQELNVATNDQPPVKNFFQLSDDEFEAISEWYHFAILELMKTKNFRSDFNWVAKRLGLHVEQIRSALDRLQRLGFIRIERNRWQLNSPNNSWTSASKTSGARRILQKKLLEQGVAAIENIPFELRENGSLTIAIDKKRLPEFKDKLRLFREDLAKFFQKDTKNLDEVYNLSLAFFPITNFKGDQK